MSIRERARNKIWSRIITKNIQINDIRKDLDEWSTVYVSDLEEYLPAYEVETWLGTNNYK